MQEIMQDPLKGAMGLLNLGGNSGVGGALPWRLLWLPCPPWLPCLLCLLPGALLQSRCPPSRRLMPALARCGVRGVGCEAGGTAEACCGAASVQGGGGGAGGLLGGLAGGLLGGGGGGGGGVGGLLGGLAAAVGGGGGHGGEPNLQVSGGGQAASGVKLPEDTGILITGCQPHETSADACPDGDPNRAFGALSNTLQTVVKAHYSANPDQPLSYRQLVTSVRDIMGQAKFQQNPCLECSHNNAEATFII